ncbi:hypothetical protein J6590_083387 [Homalodisca vitripennis]|nr:hypothetical protein J6590_083387 [Homalodisca vitripennis]
MIRKGTKSYLDPPTGSPETESDARSGRPKTSRTPEIIEKAKVLICENRRMTVEEVSTELDVSFG